jgi:hypothetical protein
MSVLAPSRRFTGSGVTAAIGAIKPKFGDTKQLPIEESKQLGSPEDEGSQLAVSGARNCYRRFMADNDMVKGTPRAFCDGGITSSSPLSPGP